MALRFPFRVKTTTSTTGTTDYTLSTSAAPAGYRLPSKAVTDGDLADGDTVGYIAVDATVVGGVKLFESGVGTYHNTNPPTLTRTIVYQPGGVAVSWGAGVRDVFFADNPLAFAVLANAGSDYNAVAFRAGIGLGTAAVLNAGTAVANLVQLITGPKLPALDGSLLTNLPAGTPSVPSGMIVPAFNNGALSGWTIINTYDDCLIGITNNSGFGGGGPFAGGTLQTGTWDTSFGLSVGIHTLSLSELPTQVAVIAAIIIAGSDGRGGSSGTIVPNSGAGTGHDHPLTSGSTFRPPTLKMRLYQKN